MNNNDKMSVEHSQIINGNVPVTNHIGCPLHWSNRILDDNKSEPVQGRSWHTLWHISIIK